MEEFFVLEFTQPAPEVIAVEYKHVRCHRCGVYPVARVGGTGVRFTRKDQCADFSRTAQGILARQSVLDHLTQSYLSGWRPGCVRVESTVGLQGLDLQYYELVVIGHTMGYSERVYLEIEDQCEECGRRKFAYPREGLLLPEECWDGSDVFVIEELGVRVVTGAFQQLVEQYKHTGLEFVPLNEWRDPFQSLKD